MIRVAPLFLFVFQSLFLLGQGYTQVIHRELGSLRQIGTIEDSTTRTHRLNNQWSNLVTQGLIPLIDQDSVAFLFRGKAKSVEWMGDFNQWGYDKKVSTKGSLIPGTDIWMWRARFPINARLDYKILINGSSWILDPENPHQQWSGVGGGSPNSELRMPEWREDPVQQTRAGVSRGRLEPDQLLYSSALGYQITYTVYLPPQLPTGSSLPVVFVTDGYEYLHPKMGNMPTVLDNLIADGKIKPVIAVFIDHREPINRANNRRMEELAMNAKYLQFFVDELIPRIEATYPAERTSKGRAILGTSMGGLNSAYFIFTRPNVFSMAGIQSPAFWSRPQIYSLCEKSGGTPIKISMTSGVINDSSEGGRKMKGLLEGTACTYQYREVNEGHSWGNWRNLIDDVLIDLLGN